MTDVVDYHVPRSLTSNFPHRSNPFSFPQRQCRRSEYFRQVAAQAPPRVGSFRGGLCNCRETKSSVSHCCVVLVFLSTKSTAASQATSTEFLLLFLLDYSDFFLPTHFVLAYTRFNGISSHKVTKFMRYALEKSRILDSSRDTMPSPALGIDGANACSRGPMLAMGSNSLQI